MERWEGDNNGKKGGTRQRTCVHDPQTWTTVWGLTVGVGGGMGRGGQGEKLGEF